MHSLSAYFFAFVLIAGTAGITYAQTAQSSIEAGNADFMAKFAAKDAAGVARHYTENAVVFPPNENRISGRDNIQKMWQGWIDGGLTDLTLRAVAVEESGDLAYEEGTYSIKIPGAAGANPTVEVGKYIVVWKKGADGNWLLHRDIWNANPAR
jgi:uncharacterized protein (TIGR02246 family)